MAHPLWTCLRAFPSSFFPSPISFLPTFAIGARVRGVPAHKGGYALKEYFDFYYSSWSLLYNILLFKFSFGRLFLFLLVLNSSQA